LFKQLSARVIIIILLTVSLSMCFLGFFTYKWTKNNILSQFIEVSYSFFQSSNDNLKQYLNYVAGSSKMISTNANVITELRRDMHVLGLTSMLDIMFANSNQDILGAAVYKNNGDTYPLYNVSLLPPLSQLKQDINWDNLMNRSNLDSYWVSRYTNLPTYRIPFQQNGVFTNILKVYDGTAGILGYTVVDLDVKNLLDLFSTNSTLFQGSQVFLISDGGKKIFKSPITDTYPLDPLDLTKIISETSNHFISANSRNLLIFDTIQQSNTKVILNIPTGNVYARIHSLKLLLELLCALFCLASLLIAVHLKNTIVSPLIRLLKKTQKFR
jgi:hypothetical protein